mmetsp:Transcript_6141/g.14232  ORF Transcript_6141/g.14232 Transcript_6141/m.14232 type:complete len:127 (+) Transcript_6141:230-610(+)
MTTTNLREKMMTTNKYAGEGNDGKSAEGLDAQKRNRRCCSGIVAMVVVVGLQILRPQVRTFHDQQQNKSAGVEQDLRRHFESSYTIIVKPVPWVLVAVSGHAAFVYGKTNLRLRPHQWQNESARDN